MRKPLIIFSGLALAALATAGGVAFAENGEAGHGSPSPAATATPAPGAPAPDTDADDTDDAGLTAKPAVLAEQAQRTALSQVGGGWIVSSELEDGGGAGAWEIGVADGKGGEREILVDAATGKVLPAEAGTAGQEDETADDETAEDETAEDGTADD
ncbi:PepSY domain-containing protein [Planomonospora venezuelensis]|uniref:Putative iron-regulated membrane protein n=1 Tax=Planomonospora venezuelensis TaxID=1999 RepID=A0A841D522_PLAVE|nr:PepSY domain-containing protein [Planomonospora venezuelensis]MBB5963594.1 putative iron-regulated membrane protein [Planomonospora venezuelensis]GIN01382.1 hypothetical protein Pve01_30400 [Planomonospora venezuelensis]